MQPSVDIPDCFYAITTKDGKLLSRGEGLLIFHSEPEAWLFRNQMLIDMDDKFIVRKCYVEVPKDKE